MGSGNRTDVIDGFEGATPVRWIAVARSESTPDSYGGPVALLLVPVT